MNYGRTASNSSDGSVGRYYDPQSGQFISVDPLVILTGLPYSYTGGNPVNQVDQNGATGQLVYPAQYCKVHPHGVGCGGVSFGGVVNVLKSVGSAFATAGTWVYRHPAETAGLILGVAAAATGVGAVIEGATLAGLGMSAASVIAGGVAAGLDAQKCLQGDTVACVGLTLGGASAFAGVFPVIGTSLVLSGSIAEGALADALLNYLPLGFGLNLGLGGLSVDIGSALGRGGQSGPSGKSSVCS